MPYDSRFIPNNTVQLPDLSERIRQTAFKNGTPIEHTRFSIIFSAERGCAVVTAHNIDGANIIPEGVIPRRDRFRFDPDVPNNLQVDNDRGYRNNPWDRGHLVRRRALHWGDQGVCEEADSQSYYWTNIAPQHETLHDAAWGHIEDWMLELTDETDQRACVFTGPVLTPHDPERTNSEGEAPTRIPGGFWKVIVIRHDSNLRSAGFLVWQRDFDRDIPVNFDPVLEQVRITTIEYLTGLSFASIRSTDPLRFVAGADRDGHVTRELEASTRDRGSDRRVALSPAESRRSAVVYSARDIIV
ncbi:MAG: DNA/RNA non-specific endonuclease [Phycisphaerales bacterium]|nr:MAG: DNA/RNA non-specific endonuclease [Phycisphaerales bacterium]